MVVIFIRLVYHDATLVRLELEVTDAVLLNVLHHIGKHRHTRIRGRFSDPLTYVVQTFAYCLKNGEYYIIRQAACAAWLCL